MNEQARRDAPTRGRASAKDLGGRRIESDVLRPLRDLAVHVPAIAALIGSVPQLTLVIDANILLREVRWRTRKRRDPAARTHLEELVANGTVVAFAPSFAQAEVDKHLSRVAQTGGVPADVVARAWDEVRAWVRFYRPADGPLGDCGYSQARAADPLDVPYYAAWRELGASAIYTHDEDFVRTDATTVRYEMVVELRDGARHAAVQLTLRLGGYSVTFAGYAAARAILRVAMNVFGMFLRLPGWAQVAVAAVVAGLLMNPNARRALLSAAKRTTAKVVSVAKVVAPELESLLAYYNAHNTQSGHWHAARGGTTLSRRPTVRQLIRSALAASGSPLDLPQISFAIRRLGYQPKGNNTAYVRRLLRSDERCAEVAPGRWTISNI